VKITVMIELKKSAWQMPALGHNTEPVSSMSDFHNLFV
jgi:hypothetical protein